VIGFKVVYQKFRAMYALPSRPPRRQ